MYFACNCSASGIRFIRFCHNFVSFSPLNHSFCYFLPSSRYLLQMNLSMIQTVCGVTTGLSKLPFVNWWAMFILIFMLSAWKKFIEQENSPIWLAGCRLLYSCKWWFMQRSITYKSFEYYFITSLLQMPWAVKCWGIRSTIKKDLTGLFCSHKMLKNKKMYLPSSSRTPNVSVADTFIRHNLCYSLLFHSWEVFMSLCFMWLNSFTSVKYL